MKATIYDVAKEAGVSIATVSKVINHKGKISTDTRNRIFEIIERLGYQPSVIASALTGKKTYMLGLLVPDIANPFFAEIARAIEDRGHQLGYSVVMCSTDNNDEKVERYISLLLQKSVDGIIIATGIDKSEILDNLMKKRVPVALIAREMPMLAMNTVVVDDYAGGCLAADHLIKLGHKQIAILAENQKVSSSRERVRGFKQTMEDAGLTFNEQWLKECEYRIGESRNRTIELLGHTKDNLNKMNKFRPTAIFACNDLLAVGALQAIKECGLSVPTDISIVSFDNTLLASVTNPALTSISQPMEDMGKLVVDLLLDELLGVNRVKQRIVLQPSLLIRDSVHGIW